MPRFAASRRFLILVALGTLLCLQACENPGPSVVGSVIDGETNLPIVGAIVSLGEATMETDSRGAFRLDSIPRGNYRIDVSAEAYTPLQRAIQVSKASEQSIAPLYLQRLPQIGRAEDQADSEDVMTAVVRVAVQASAGASITIDRDEDAYAGGLRLEIPSGALPEDAVVTIGVLTKSLPPIPEHLTPVSAPISILPHGVTLSAPAIVSIPFDDEMLDWADVDDPESLLLLHYVLSEGHWESVPVDEIDVVAQTVTGRTNQFGFWNVFAPKSKKTSVKDKEIVAFINEQWDIAMAAADLSLIDEVTNMSFRDEIGGAITALSMAEYVAHGKYGKAIRTGGKYALWGSLKSAGFGWLQPYAVVAGLTYRIGEYFVRSADEGAFNRQICAYLYYIDGGFSEEDIYDVIGFTSDDGWLLTTGTGCPGIGNRALLRKYTATDVPIAGRAILEARDSDDYMDSDLEMIGQSLRNALAPRREPEAEDSPSASEGDPDDIAVEAPGAEHTVEIEEQPSDEPEAEAIAPFEVDQELTVAVDEGMQPMPAEAPASATHLVVFTANPTGKGPTGEPIAVGASLLDADNQPVEGGTYRWELRDGESVRILGREQSVSLQMSDGVHTVYCVAQDPSGVIYEGSTQLTYAEIEPGPSDISIESPVDQAIYEVGTVISFTGTAYDPVLGSYEAHPMLNALLTWKSDIDGELGTGRDLTRDDLSAGMHTITFTAIGNDYGEASATTSIYVHKKGLNQAPTIVVEPLIETQAGASVTLDASDTYDPNGDPITFSWSQVRGPIVSLTDETSDRLAIDVHEPGEYSFGLTVQDLRGDRSSAEVLVVVRDREQPAEEPSPVPFAPAPQDGTLSLLVWQEQKDGAAELVGRVLDAIGQPTKSRSLGIAQTSEDDVNLAVVGGRDEWLVLWQQERNGGIDLVGSRVSSESKLLDREPFVVCSVESEHIPYSCTYQDEQWLVAWPDDARGSIQGRRVPITGSALSSSFTLKTLEWASPLWGLAIETGPDCTLLAWSDVWESDVAVWGALFGGNEPNDTFRACDTQYGQWCVGVEANQHCWTLAWIDERDEKREYIYAARVRFDGSVVDPDGIALGPAARYQLGFGDLATDDHRSLAVWMDYGEYDTGIDFSVQGTLLDVLEGTTEQFTIAESAGELESLIAASFNGQHYLVAWQENDYTHTISRILIANVTDSSTPAVISEVIDDSHASLGGWLDIDSLWRPERNGGVSRPLETRYRASSPGDAVRRYWQAIAEDAVYEAALYAAADVSGEFMVAMSQILMASLRGQGAEFWYVSVATVEIDATTALVEARLVWEDATSKTIVYEVIRGEDGWRIQPTDQ